MRHFKAVLLIFAVAVIIVSFATQRVQADVPSSPSTTTVIYLPLVVKNYQPPLNKIVYSSGYTSANPTYNIYVMNPDGTGQTQLTSQTGLQYQKPSWSPDGSKIAFYIVTPLGNNRVDLQIDVMNADGSGIHKLTDLPGENYSQTWSPDGAQIAFASANTGDIYVVNVDGSGSPVNLTNSPASSEYWPDWSPDGKKIAFSSCTGVMLSMCQIYVMNADGSGQTNVSQSAYFDSGPNWSPNSQKIAFYRNLGSSSSPDRQIFVMNADGSGQTQLTNNSAQNYRPNWSPDGTRIVFQASYSNYPDIYVMNADGTGVTNITNHQSSYASVAPDWR